MHAEKNRMEEFGITVILVGMGSPKQAEAFRTDHKLTFVIICDPRKRLYEAYGLHKAGITGIVSPKTIIGGLRALGRGHLPGLPSGDIFQLSGTFLIDKHMGLLYAHYAVNIADHPSVDEIIGQLPPIQ
ncbi:MAG: redoxin domain-containing protein [Nitrospirae bacterium]|nr:redoxin domain-containing protein [Nitrospirota bacterium]